MENCNFDKYILQELRECSRIECKFLAAALPRVKTTPSMELSQRRSDPLTNVPKSKKETNSSTSTNLNTNMLQWSRFPNPKKRQIIFILNTITATLINFCHKLPPSNCTNLYPPLIFAARIDFKWSSFLSSPVLWDCVKDLNALFHQNVLPSCFLPHYSSSSSSSSCISISGNPLQH